MMQSLEIKVNNKVGLHARPATLFVKEVAKYTSRISVKNLTTESPAVDARSLLMVLSIGVEQGHMIQISAEGPDENLAINAMREIVENNFGEK